MEIDHLWQSQHHLHQVRPPLIRLNKLNQFQNFRGMVPEQKIAEQRYHMIVMDLRNVQQQLFYLFVIGLIIPQIIQFANNKLSHLNLRIFHKWIAPDNL